MGAEDDFISPKEVIMNRATQVISQYFSSHPLTKDKANDKEKGKEKEKKRNEKGKEEKEKESLEAIRSITPLKRVLEFSEEAEEETVEKPSLKKQKK